MNPSADADFRVESEVDVYGILGTLVKHEVDFVVIGVIAVARHGFVRATKDVDIVPAPTGANLTKLVAALHELEAEPLALQDSRRDELPLELTVATLALGGNWDLSTKRGRLDVMQYVEGALEIPQDYDRLRRGAVVSHLEVGAVAIVGYEDLLDLKQLASRDVDLIDIRALREARRDTRP
jgi:hypothetical protein